MAGLSWRFPMAIELLESEAQAAWPPVSQESSTAVVRVLLAALGRRCPRTAAHSERVGALTARLAERLGWVEYSLEDLELAASLHDLGKIALPDAILVKPGPLTIGEYSEVKKHPEIGAEILGASSLPLFRTAAEIALYHHERWDGGGYPNGVPGPEIPRLARIVAVVDFYDALRIARTYRDEMSEGQVVAMMRQVRGRYFDPRVLECFFDTLATFSPSPGVGAHSLRFRQTQS